MQNEDTHTMTIDVAKAERYNRNQPHSRQEWQRAQMVMAARPDGIPGKETAGQVAAYQERNDLAVDGMLGPLTMADILADRAPWEEIEEVGEYWDCPPKWTVNNAPALADTLHEHGIDLVKIMLTSSDCHTWRPEWSTRQLEDFSLSLAARGICTAVTAWGLPWRAVLHGMRDNIKEYIEAAGAVRFELDAEEHLLKKHVRDYPKDRVLLATDLKAVLDAARAANVPAGVSCYADLFGREDTFHNRLTSSADIFSLQAYQVEGGKGSAFTSSGPGIKQWDGYRKYVERVSPRPALPMSMAYACWDQDFDGPISDEDSQLLSIEQGLRLGVRRFDRWAALHWIAGAGVTKKYDARKAAYNRRGLLRLKALRNGGQ